MQTNLSSKIITKGGQANLSGDDVVEINKKIKATKENEGARKLKRSLIPTRKTNTQKVCPKETSNSLQKTLLKTSHIGQNNVQRVQHLHINQDINSSEVQSTPKSVARARPIPTLQHIYREDLSNETFTDWFLESVSEYQDIPEDDRELNIPTAELPIIETKSSVGINIAEFEAKSPIVTNIAENSNEQRPLTNNLMPGLFNINPRIITYKSTNENVQDWLSSKLEHPTRDNESGYQSMSRPSQYDLSLKSRKSYTTKPFGDDRFYIFQNALIDSSLKKSALNRNNLGERFANQPTVVIDKTKKDSFKINSIFSAIPKLNTDIKLNQKQTDVHKPMKYPSSPNPVKKFENKENHPINSYINYPSEVLQKTTNFDANGCEINSNVIGANSGIQDDVSSQCTIEHGNEYGIPADSDADWSRLQSSQENTTIVKSSKTSNLTDESWRLSFCDDKNEGMFFKSPDKDSCHDYYYHYCWRKEVAKKNRATQELWDCKGRCKKCQKYRVSPYRKKLAENKVQHIILRSFTISSVPRSLKKFKTRISIGRICRRRWNCVWKKTAERWANWSKSPHKFRKWTDAAARERKSPDISSAINNSLSRCKFDPPVVPSMKAASHVRHANVGPSMFLFNNQSHKITSVENKVTSAIINLCSMNVDTVFQDANTQMTVSCNNAETNIKLSPATATEVMRVQTSDNFHSTYGVDEGTQAAPSVKSQTSIKIMTSNRNLQELMDKEIQASPVSSIKKVSAAVVVQDCLRDAKSSVVTDTSLPYRRLKNVMITPKGTVLSCTGTKITSVSSVQIQTASIISEHPKITTSTAVSTDVCTGNRECSTAPSLFLRHHEDVSLGTEDKDKSEKSTSYAQFTDYINAGLSTSNLVKLLSFNDGVHQTQGSFGAAFHPESVSIFTSTDIESRPITTATGSSFERQAALRNALNKTDCYSQYSNSRKSNQLSNNSADSAHIGRSRLLSVKTLGGSLCESAQAQTICSSFDKRMKTTQEESVSASQFNSIDALGLCRTSNSIQTSEIGKNEKLKPVSGEIRKNKTKSIGDAPQREPSLVVSSNFNAAKWIKGCVNESRKDVQSIINLSESTVTESLERASYAIINSGDKKNLNEMKNLSKVVINQQRAINCVTAKPLGVVSTVSVMEICPTKDASSLKAKEKPIISNKLSECRNVAVDNMTSGEILNNDTTESIQVRPEVRETATDYDQTKVYKSNFAITSHCILPEFHCCGGHVDKADKVAALLNRMTSQMTSCTLCAHADCYLRCNHTDSIEDIKSHLTSNCRHYRNMLAMKLALFKENWQKHLAPSIENTVYQTETLPNVFIEACTMKPSGRTDANCQTKVSQNTVKVKNNLSRLLSPAYSLVDIRGSKDKDDLKAVYDILTAIEGRVRRIKNNLRT